MMNKTLGILFGVVLAHNVGASNQSQPANAPLTTKMINSKATELWEQEDLDADQRIAYMTVWLQEQKDRLGKEAVNQAMNPAESATQVPLQEAANTIESVGLFKLYLRFNADPLRVYGGRSILAKLNTQDKYRDAIQGQRAYNVCEPYIQRLLAGDFPDVVAADLKGLVDSKVIPLDELFKVLEKIVVQKKREAALAEQTITEVENLAFSPKAQNGQNKPMAKQTRWLHRSLTEPKVSIGQLLLTTGTAGLIGYALYKLMGKDISFIMDKPSL